MKSSKVVLVVGAGDAIGSAILRRFAQAGFVAVGVRRNVDRLAPLVAELNGAGLQAHAFACDAREEDQVVALFNRIEGELGPIEVCVFNVGANVPMSILDTPAVKFRKIWEMACYAGFLTGKEAAKVMTARHHGTIIFTGASASLRGKAGFGAFAAAKSALRAMAQSLAKEVAAENVHVAHVVIDAAVDTAWIRENVLPLRNARKPDDIINPSSIAETYLMLHQQPRDAWTFEMDLRPWVEPW